MHRLEKTHKLNQRQDFVQIFVGFFSKKKKKKKKSEIKKFSELKNFITQSMSVSDNVSVRKCQDLVNVRVR